jgi:hypothetical protein
MPKLNPITFFRDPNEHHDPEVPKSHCFLSSMEDLMEDLQGWSQGGVIR